MALRTRVNWDDYFMVQALWAKVRSPDTSTQCGSIIVDKRGRIVGQGYNGYPRGVNDDKMPQTRPEKYPPILHSEENAILNSTGDLEGATAYISGPPCIHCWAHIIQKGIQRVVYGPITTSPKGLYMDAKLEGVNQVVADMLEDQGIEVVRWVPKNALLIKEELAQIVQMITTTEE
jgi:dCMP deaminase